MYPTDLLAADNTGLFQQWIGIPNIVEPPTYDTSQPLATATSFIDTDTRRRDRFIVAVMWTDDTAQASAMAVTTATDKTAIRFYAKECRIVSHKSTFDGILKVNITFKYPAFDAVASGTITKSDAWESTNDTDTSPLPALTYT